MAELVDALDSKSSILGCAGSIPAPGTKREAFEGLLPFFCGDKIGSDKLLTRPDKNRDILGCGDSIPAPGTC